MFANLASLSFIYHCNGEDSHQLEISGSAINCFKALMAFLFDPFCHVLYGKYLFSTSVELESENFCLCVCPKTLGQPGDFKNGLILAEIWDTCSSGEYKNYFRF